MKKRKMIMRRIVAVLLALVMIGSAVDMSGVTVHAEETVVDYGFFGAEGDGTNLTWQVTENGETYTLTISGTGAMKDYEDMFADDIPGGVYRDRITTIVIENGVTSIGDYAFAECTSLASVTIPSSVTSIGNGAFFACESLTDINIPSSVTSIGSAFRRCSSLTSIVLPEGITNISEYMFAECTSLASVTIPSSVTSIGDSAFDNCTSLMSVVLPEGVESIGDSAFVGCTSLETINFPSTTTSIGQQAFEICTSLTSAVLPEGVTSVGARAFYKCTALKNVSIPSSLTSIPNSMFNGCTSLANITIPKGVTSIGWNAFMYCKALTSVIIPEGVTDIGPYSFGGNDLLEEITIPSSVEKIGDGAFKECPVLQTVNVPCNWDTVSPLYTFPENTTVKKCDGVSSPYTASGATITKKCSACGFDEGSLTLVSPSGLTYDGNEKQATITGSINGVENPIITYNTTDGSAPIYPGNYTASITLGDATASVSYEIGKKTITVSVAETISREYDGTNKVRIYSCECEGVLVPDSGWALIDCDGLWGTVASANVGTYCEVTMPQNLTIGPENRGYYIIEQPTGPVWTEVTITKASVTPGMPDVAMGVANKYTKVGDIPLAANWQWQDADKETALEVETPVSATAEYVAADKDNYENISVTVTITRTACDHVAGNVLYTGAGEKAPTCTAAGLGHKECTKCGTVMESGIVVGTTGHSGELRHYEEPTCTTEGYSGDTYCSDCGSWLSGGVTLSVTGHNYVGVVTRKATTEREGIRTYTCSKCGGSYTASIAKLIADTTAEKPADKNDEKWENVREELGDTNEGTTVTVDMADTTVVPGTVFDDIKGKDITTIFVLENGITWSVNGKDITSEKVNDIDLGVKVGADANHTIPVEVINNVSGERTYTNISLAYEGEFGFKAVMALNMDAKNAGLFANLFYFNEQTNALEFICADEIAEDGTAELIFTHASEYTIVIDTEEMSGALDSSDVPDTTEPDTEVNVEPEVEADSTNGGSALWIILLVAVLTVAGVALVWKRKKN